MPATDQRVVRAKPWAGAAGSPALPPNQGKMTGTPPRIDLPGGKGDSCSLAPVLRGASFPLSRVLRGEGGVRGVFFCFQPRESRGRTSDAQRPTSNVQRRKEEPLTPTLD